VTRGSILILFTTEIRAAAAKQQQQQRAFKSLPYLRNYFLK